MVVLALVGVAAAAPPHHGGPHGTDPREVLRASRDADAAGPPQYGPPPPAYKPAPAPYKPGPPPPKGYKQPEYPPQPYEFQYGVSDAYSGTNFQAIENQNEKGAVVGTYKVNLPDGRVQTVTYTADDYGGFVADVKYEGEAVYPPEPAEGYGNSYKPAPKYAPGPAKRQ